MIEIKLREIKKQEIEKTLIIIHKALVLSNSPDYPEKIINYQVQVHYTEEWFKKKLTTNYFIVATINEEIVGTGSAKGNELQHIFINPDYQRQGVGTKILSHLEQYCKKQHYKEVKLEPSVTGLGFYIKLGYKLVKNEPTEWLGEQVREMVMRKDI